MILTKIVILNAIKYNLEFITNIQIKIMEISNILAIPISHKCCKNHSHSPCNFIKKYLIFTDLSLKKLRTRDETFEN